VDIMSTMLATAAPAMLDAGRLTLKVSSSTVRHSMPRMGFEMSPKQLSDDPTIPEALAMAAVERAEREARMALASASGFVPGGLELIRKLPGCGPFGFFDPLRLAPECQREVLVWREAELTHGRIAMLAAVGFLAQEYAHPVFPDASALAIGQLSAVDWNIGSLMLFIISWAEVWRLQRGWCTVDSSSASSYAATVRTLKATYSPGTLGFDPLNLKPSNPEAYATMQEKELNNGRLSMIAVAGFVGQELATGAPVFASA